MPARTVCAAFQDTVAEHPDRVALRTRDGERELTWADYDLRVRRIAAGLHALGLRRGDTLALMVTNRPEFHLVDAAAMHLGALPFSMYNTSSPEQVEFLLRDSGARIAVVEEQFRDRVDAEQVIDVDHLDALEGDDGLRLRRRLAGGRARRPADADLHVGHHRRPQGRRAHAQEHAVHDARLRRGAALRARRPRHLLPADGARRRAQLLALLPDAVRLHGHLLPGRARGHELLPRGPPVVVLRRPADLREAEGGDRVRPRHRATRPPCASSSAWTGCPRSTSAPPRARPR